MLFILSYGYVDNGTVANTIKIKNIVLWDDPTPGIFLSWLFPAYFKN